MFLSPKCLYLFKLSPDVLLLHCTFKTNKYKLPLLNLVGSNGNNRTIHLGVALMQRRDEASFVWILSYLKSLLTAHNASPRLRIADNDNACINTLREVFARAKIVLYR
jgi:hypothetical protein